MRNECRLGADWVIYVLSDTLRPALQLLYSTSLSVAHVKAKQHIRFMGRDHSPHLVGPE